MLVTVKVTNNDVIRLHQVVSNIIWYEMYNSNVHYRIQNITNTIYGKNAAQPLVIRQ